MQLLTVSAGYSLLTEFEARLTSLISEQLCIHVPAGSEIKPGTFDLSLSTQYQQVIKSCLNLIGAVPCLIGSSCHLCTCGYVHHPPLWNRFACLWVCTKQSSLLSFLPNLVSVTFLPDTIKKAVTHPNICMWSHKG